MDNQQLYHLNDEQLQVFLTSQLGDGCITTSNTNSVYYSTCCIHREYIEFKKRLLGPLFKNISYKEHNGFCQTPIWTMRSCSLKELKNIKDLPLSKILEQLNELGIALWFYDDGSLHKTKDFYNLNTQKFSKEVQEQIIIPFFHKFEIYPVLTIERKKDGREFWYLRIGVRNGADKVNAILQKYPLDCFSYKRWSSETILKRSRAQESSKSKGEEIPKI